MKAKPLHSEQLGVTPQDLGHRLDNPSLRRGLVWGSIGGLAGTMLMDLFGTGLFLAAGLPPSLSFSVCGDAAAGFLAWLGQTVAGGAPLGALLHYVIGPVLGAALGAAVTGIAGLRLDSTAKGLGLGVLFVEVVSQPLLAAAAVVLKMTPAEAVPWFGVAFAMHLVYGLVLGASLRHGLRSSTLPAAQPAGQNSAKIG